MDAPATSDLLAQNTRRHLVTALRELRRAADTRELAGKLGLHPNGVRRHLEQLELAGVVSQRKVGDGPGRPRSVWSLVPGAPTGAPPRRYEDISAWLARALAAGASDSAAIENEGRSIGREIVDGSRATSPAEQFGDALTAMGFDPECEVTAVGTARWRLCNCPYLEAAGESPRVVCTMHRGITSGMLEALDPSARLVSWEPGDPAEAGCIAEVAAAGWASDLPKDGGGK